MPPNVSIILRMCVALFAAVVGQAAVGHTAYAAEPSPSVSAMAAADLSVRLSGLQLESRIDHKVIVATVTNHGPATARGIVFEFTGWLDGEVVDPGTVHFCPPLRATQQWSWAEDPPRVVKIGGRCKVPDLVPGQSAKLYSRTTLWAGGAIGQIGELTPVVSHSGADPVSGNNSVTGLIVVNGARGGVDLYTRVSDVPVGADGKAGSVAPGATAELRYKIGNNGWVASRGLKVEIQLPAQVSFAESRPNCEYSPNGRIATCTYPELVLVPVQDDDDPGDKIYSELRFTQRIRVSPDAPAPTYLDGGVVTAEPIAIVSGRASTTTIHSVLPDGVTGSQGRDIDVTDNVDRFVVFTGRAGGSGGGLPVTGAPAGLLGGIGLASMILGGVLLRATRQRRQAPVGGERPVG